MKKIYNNLAIVGMGPRGLSALEHFIIAFSRNRYSPLRILLFEPAKYPGAGKIWDLDQSACNWANIPERRLKELKERPEINFPEFNIPHFPSYLDWLPSNQHLKDGNRPDKYPQRKLLGQYLHERFISMSSILIQQNIIQLITKTIVNVHFEEPYFKLTDEDQNSYQCQEVLLTIGHQPTQNSKQLKRWSNFSKSKDSITLFENAYPLDQFDDQNKFIEGQIVAIRGFGLSMLDIMRSLTTDRQGSFKTIDDKLKSYNYIDSLQTPQKIIPFSLDGLPLAAKPLTAKIDDQFKPISSDIKFFKEITMRMSKGDFEDELAVQHKVISEIAVNVYSQIENRIYLIRDKQELIQTAYKWLEDEHYTHIILQDLKKETEVIIDDYVQMALNAKPITLDYCIGQVWRHLQPVWYKWFSHSCVNEDTLKKLIALHERLKRFSYGPPVESMQQLLSLIRFGKVDLRFVKDPEISLTEKGWKLTKNGHIATVPCMINGVLDSPKLLKTNSSLIKGLLANQLIQPVHSKLGIQTNEHALIVRPKNESSIALGVLGRLTIGSIVGTDSLIECFGSRISDWATEAVKRINT